MDIGENSVTSQICFIVMKKSAEHRHMKLICLCSAFVIKQ